MNRRKLIRGSISNIVNAVSVVSLAHGLSVIPVPSTYKPLFELQWDRERRRPKIVYNSWR